MTLIQTLLMLALLLPVPFAVYLCVLLLKTRTRVVTPLMLIVIAGGSWLAGYALELVVRDPLLMHWAVIFQYCAITYGPVAWFLLGARLRRYVVPLNSWIGVSLFIVPTITMLLVLSPDHHSLIWVEKTIVDVYGFTAYDNTYGGYFWVHIFYSYSMNFVGVLLVSLSVLESRSFYMWQRAAILLALAMPWLTNAVHIFRIGDLGIGLSPTTILVSGIAVYVSVVHFRLGELLPIDRSRVISDMTDGMLLFNSSMEAIDHNDATTQFFEPGDVAIGMTAERVFPNHPRLHRFLERDPETNIELVYTGFENRVVRLNNEVIEGGVARLMVFRDVSSDSRIVDGIQVVLAEVGQEVGEAFFNSLVRSLANVLGMQVGLIGAISKQKPDQFEALAVWNGDNFSYSLIGTSCMRVAAGKQLVVTQGVMASFPEDLLLRDLAANSFIGMPLFGHDGSVLGLMAFVGPDPMTQRDTSVSLVEIFALRVAAELERQAYQQRIETSESNYGQIVEASKDGVCVTSANGVVEFVNEPMLEILGLGSRSVLGSLITDFVTVDGNPDLLIELSVISRIYHYLILPVFDQFLCLSLYGFGPEIRHQ